MRAQQIRPVTKAELVHLRKEIKVSQEGLELLEHKRDILMAEGLQLLKSAKALRAALTQSWGEIEKQWQAVLNQQSTDKLQCLADALKPLAELQDCEHRWMSVKFAQYKSDAPKLDLLGSICELDLRVESVRGQLAQRIPQLIELMNIESNIRRIAAALKQCHRQVNALTQVVIPELLKAKSRIEQRLEEKERETIFQVKLLKARLL
ncbi:V-type ATP synthase subunit D [Psychromonas aquimarina]|uniref:V-type ATP synthase subunit D n=1 Tax=Psychromonas aquimarina TaxID=444919 RepID=UPI0003FD5366|nr:V-type ATP synthase subunit D [Psychromonas aquimarina]